MTVRDRALPPVVTPASRLDPYPLYRMLRDSSPVHWDEETRSWYVSRRDDMVELLRDPRLGAHTYPDWVHHLPPPERRDVVPVEDHLARWPVFSDRPAQHVLRRRLQPALSRTAVAPMGEAIGEITRSLARGLGEGPADLLTGFARPAATWTLSRLLGVSPEEDGPRLVRWSDALVRYLGSTGVDVRLAGAARVAVEELTGYVVSRMLTDPVTPVAQALARALEGEETVELDDVVAMVAQLVTGGVEPTATATCVMALRHAQSPQTATPGTDTRAQAPVGPDAPADGVWADVQVEEALRFDPPFHFAPREVKEDFHYRGHSFVTGQRVVLILASAGHDTAGGEATSRCPVSGATGASDGAGRPPVAKAERATDHLAFGRGRHYCLGASPARLHLRMAWLALAEARVLERVDAAAVERIPDFGMTSFRACPLRPAREMSDRSGRGRRSGR
ncbi:cytochrome P450 [Streptomyces sp. AHA2]|uniref:cytochrome P450 n=1 Tax=Streptomyces sp. AHA2 TaxID=3064526 RepID=UPI002FE31A70